MALTEWSVVGAFPSHQVSFGPFVFDVKTGELHNNGTVVKLAPQPCRVLILLTSRPGELVTRDEIQKTIWGEGTFVDFDKGLTFCIKQIREALSDGAEHPRYIETLPRRGYRFIADVGNVPSAKLAQSCGPARVVEPSDAENDRTVDSSHRTWLWSRWALAAMTVIVVFAVGWRMLPRRTAFPQRGWVLIANFENRTGDADIGNGVELALERELRASRYVNVVPPERVQDGLRLMKRSPDSKLDATLAREVATRDGNTQLVITGQLEKDGDRYLITASFVDPTTGARRGTRSIEAKAAINMSSAVRDLGLAIREALGESLPALPRPAELQKVTTPSLRALLLYSQATKQHRWASSETDASAASISLLEQAIAVDPEFASAHLALGCAYLDLARDAEAAPHFQRALALADTTSEREKLFIIAAYDWRYTKELHKALNAFRVLVELYPDYLDAVDGLATVSWRLGRPEQALPYLVRLAELRPNDFSSTVNAWGELNQYEPSSARTQQFLVRAQQLASDEEGRRDNPEGWAGLQLHFVDQRLRRGELREALQELERAAAIVPTISGSLRDIFVNELGDRYVRLGRFRDADAYYQKLPAERKWLALSILAEYRGDRQAAMNYLRQQLRTGGVSRGPHTAARLIHVGLVAEAESLLASKKMLRYHPRYVEIARAELLAANGRRAEAKRRLIRSLEGGDAIYYGTTFWAADALAGLLLDDGDIKGAIQVYEQALTRGDADLTLEVARARSRLWKLYRSVGNSQRAAELRHQLRSSLAVADRDHFLLRELESEQ